jgi:hypothetical protein
MTTWADLPLSAEHSAVLELAAITPAVAAAIGVRTATAAADLPEDLAYLAEKEGVFPALLFPWREPDGTLRTQIKPAAPVVNAAGKHAKYLFGQGNHAQLTAVRTSTEATRVLIVEGSKQSLAAASYAPADLEVYGVLGCRGWMSEGVPTPHLAVVEDKDVMICLDGDVASNLDVYTAAVALADACKMQGASSVSYIRLAAGKKAGLDDVLGAQVPDRRAGMLLRMIGNSTKKPADTKPKPKRATTAGRQEVETDRQVIPVNGDRHAVINDLTRALMVRWDGITLFNFGNALSRVDGHVVTPLERGEFLDTLAATAVMVNRAETADGEVKETHAWPDPNVIQSVASRGRRFTPLEQVQRAPFVRVDGTVCSTPGYDADSRTLLAMPEGLEVEVSADPSAEGVAAAVKFLQDEWLGDFPFPTESDRANALALILTPLTRGLYPLAPVAVVNGLQMGVGKNKFANAVSIVATGEMAAPLGYNRDGEEQRKVMTSVFRTGRTLMVFDECHHLEGEHFARAITSPTYADRVLGGSVMVEFPNRATWMTLGNGVRVEGDMMRRVYQIAMRTDHPNPQDRPSSAFRHPDIEGWTLENRATILGALLTLVSAWCAAGRPGPGTSFGSFEGWERVVGGILAHAGVSGFLGNMKAFRSDSDYSVALWDAHLAGLREHFGNRDFVTKDVVTWLSRHPDTAEAPPGLADLSAPGYARNLGQAYQRHRDRWYGGFRLVRREGTGHGKVAKWSVDIHPGTGTEGVPRQREGQEATPSAIPPDSKTPSPGETKIMEGVEVVEVGKPPTYGENSVVNGDQYTDSSDTVTGAPDAHMFFTYRGPGDLSLHLHSLPRSDDPWYAPDPFDPETPRRAVNPFVDYPDPLEELYALARPELDLRCPDCDREREPVPPAGIGWACPDCQAPMFR